MKHFQHQWQAYDVLFNQAVTVVLFLSSAKVGERALTKKGVASKRRMVKWWPLHGGEISVRRG